MRAKNVIATVVCLLLTSAMFAQKRNITEKDIFELHVDRRYAAFA